ncbi:MAG: hypothetical protein K1X55_14270 [Chitinophagales bacterium]|nr:hypothetical protein [Chitinophagales bacterium]
MKKTTFLMVLMVATLVLFNSCKKEAIATDTEETSEQLRLAVDDQQLVDDELDKVERVGDDEEAYFDSGTERMDSIPEDGPCITKTWSGDSLTKILTIDYGSAPCLCLDSVYRSGKIIFTFSGKKFQIGATKTVRFINYTVNGHVFNGERVRIYVGNATYRRKVEQMSMTYQDSTSTWKSDETVVVLRGFETIERDDDIRQVTGSTWGLRRNGVAFRSEIKRPLIRKGLDACSRYFVEGIVETKENNRNTILFNYDPYNNGACDNLASVSFNGQPPIIVEIKYRR